MHPILDRINSPADIKGLSIEELRQLCSELRGYIVGCCSKNPGHLASSLGAVDIITALHYVYDTPSDKLVFDVGHQTYAHKILTGRREAFARMRTRDGISGFPRRDESPYDTFGAGHSSTAVSAALGLAEAARIAGSGEKVVAVLGDGALTGGLAFEGLNNAGASKADLLVILNDNDQSIDRNRGAIHDYLLKVTTNRSYNDVKAHIWDILGDSGLRKFIQRWTRSLKAWLVKRTGGDLFEAMGFRYFGPIDGNDLQELIDTLQRIRDMHGPRIIHCITRKGKGYAPAEADPAVWHAPGKFDAATGEILHSPYTKDRFQDVFGQVLCELAAMDGSVVGITPAMARGCGMSGFAAAFPGRFFDVGIEEEHAVTFSAGLAAGGMKPFCNIYSSFAQRAYDQIIHDVALQKLPVTICLDRAGLVGEDGPTHHGVFDLAAFRCIPDAIISAPKDELELKQLMYTAYKHKTGPFLIRYPRGMAEGTAWKDVPFAELPFGKAETLLEGSDVAVITIGPLAYRALEAAADFQGKVGVYNFRYLKPLDTRLLDELASTYKVLVTVEDGCLKGGLFGAVSEYLAGKSVPVEGIGIPDEFIPQGKQSEERAWCGIDTEGIRKILQKYLENTK